MSKRVGTRAELIDLLDAYAWRKSDFQEIRRVIVHETVPGLSSEERAADPEWWREETLDIVAHVDGGCTDVVYLPARVIVRGLECEMTEIVEQIAKTRWGDQ